MMKEKVKEFWGLPWLF